MRGSWPDLVRRAMGVLGADEMNAARAVVAVQELVETLACVVHDDLNAGGHWDYQEPFSNWPATAWIDPDFEAWLSRYAFGHCCSDDKDDDGVDPLDGGFEINSEMMDCAYAAVPNL